MSQNNSNSKAEVLTKLPDLQIDGEDWKKNKVIKHTKSGRIDQIIDPLTIILKDKTVIRLASLDIPKANTGENFGLKALEYLKTLLPETSEVMLYQTRNAKSGRVNRMNHDLAHIVTKDNNVWVQGSMLQNGLARIYTAAKNAELLNEMQTAENIAIKKGLGIWTTSSPHKIISPDQTPDALGDFAVIEGTIQKVASIRNNIYLNFGANWKTDFTIMITPQLRKKFARDGIDLMSLANEPVRVRGWLREYNGPFIELEATSHLQILGNPSNLPITTEDTE